MENPIAGIGQASIEVRCMFRSIVKSRISKFSTTIDAFVLPKVTVDLPSISVDASSWSLPTGIQLADPSFYQSGVIDVVLGAEVFFDLFNVAGRIILGESLPCLVNSVFGWIISGKTSEQHSRSSVVCNVATTADIHRDMERFWAIEDDSTIVYSASEAYCEKFFSETTRRCEDGWYMVRVPFKEDVLDKLGDKKRTALHRFRLIEGRFGRDPKLAAEYRKFMDEYEELGHMERIDESDAASGPAYFLPHHPVIREESSTTKVRVVFDASCKSSTGISLNDAMLVGPIVQEDLRYITMRSRLHPIMMIADVAKMYRQMVLFPRDCRFHLIFWRPLLSEPICIYKLKTVTYGTASAPYLATRVLKKLAEDEKERYPLAAKATCEDFYVDDFFSGAQTVTEAIELREQMDAMFNSAGMQLRKWASNYPALLEGVPEYNRALQPSMDFDKDQAIKTLGLHWEPCSDQLKYVVPEATTKSSTVVTKRSTLSCIAKPTWFHDSGKQYEWDKELPEQMKKRWVEYYTELPHLNALRIDRFVILPNTTSVELHFFSDASLAAYGSCAYIRSSNESGEVKVALLTSRSKVSPLKQQSILRLELCGALLSAELYQKVYKALRITSKAYFWVDSTTVLSWLKATPSTWSTFVGNRVSKIQQKTENCEWNHVVGRENPADIISRGLPAADLIQCRLWWEGPPWLRGEKESWKVSVDACVGNEAAKEARKSSFAVASSSPSFVEEYHIFASECATNGIRWHFNPPRGSHFGGLWEAAINSAQKHYFRVLGDRKLAFDDMETLLVQIEACLNSRPLTKLSEDPSDFQALTPGHFLIGSSLQSVPGVDYESIPANRLHQWQLIQKLLQDIWKRWHVEYLVSLQPRSKWCKPPVPLHENQLVVIVDENQPPMRWATARIHDLHPGKDDVVRVVTLQTATEFLTRPTAKIFVLPIPPSADDQPSTSAAPQLRSG
ncbi:uncharacterized protein LOC135704378 [Ochlerotatus camptorhynchus]|uniref:uncharacterized protein LOC135704378 n=1 Tax=Ochlerotatus camptorhynchus TaxID=644619 RepID=UPI0031D1AC85